MTTAHLIFNPISGQGDAAADLAVLQSHLGAKFDLSVSETSPDTSAVQLAQAAVEQGAEVVVASGGDGTVSEVASALVNTQISLGVVPRGTANAIAAALDIPTNIAAACQVIAEQHIKKIDIATCNGHPLVLLAGVGLEANVIALANRELKNRLGTAAYVLSALRQIQQLERFTAKLETSDRIIRVEAAAITVANVAPATSVLAQGPARVAPDDGALDVTIFAPQNVGNALMASYNLFQSALNQNSATSQDVGFFRCQTVSIVTDPPQKVVIDGEMRGETPIDTRCIPQGLTVLVPEHAAADPHEKLDGLPGLEIEYKRADG